MVPDEMKFETLVDDQSTAFQEYVSAIIAKLPKSNKEYKAIQDEIKAELAARSVDTLAGTDWRVTWKNVTSNRLDSTALKKEMPEIAARFMKQTTARRFVLA